MDWLKIAPLEFNRPARREVRGVSFEVYFSPYVVPTGVRGYYDDSLKRFLIEFRYLDDEAVRTERQDEHVSLRVGRRTRRLFGIEIDVDRLQVEAVRLSVTVGDRLASIVNEAIGKHEKALGRSSNHDNCDAARRVVSGKHADIFTGLRWPNTGEMKGEAWDARES